MKTMKTCGQLCQPKIIFGGIKNQAQIRALLKNKQTNKKKRRNQATRLIRKQRRTEHLNGRK